MKKVFFYVPFICLIFLFTFCNKEKSETGSDYYMSAKVDGVQKTYKVNAVAVKIQLDTVYAIGLNAIAEAGSEERFFLNIAQVNKPITTGTYIDAASDNLVVVGGYNPGTTDDARLYAAGLQIDNNTRLHITLSGLSASNVNGSFYGTFYDHGGDGPGIIAVTEGKFNLPLP